MKYMMDLKISENEIASYEYLRKKMESTNIDIYSPGKIFVSHLFHSKIKIFLYLFILNIW